MRCEHRLGTGATLETRQLGAKISGFDAGPFVLRHTLDEMHQFIGTQRRLFGRMNAER